MAILAISIAVFVPVIFALFFAHLGDVRRAHLEAFRESFVVRDPMTADEMLERQQAFMDRHNL